MGLPYEFIVLIIILCAATSVLVCYVIWRMFFLDPLSDVRLVQQMSQEQKDYAQSVRERNVRALMMELQFRS